MSFGVDTLGYYQQGDPLWKSTVKGGLEALGSLAGGFVGASIGVSFGLSLFPEDISGVPEAAFGFMGSLGGGFIGGFAGNWVATRMFGN